MKQDRSWSQDFGDDTIRQFDIRVKNIVDFLKDNKLYDNTLLVITSDHGSRWRNRERVPLMIKLPHAAKTGRVKENVQRLDLATTLLNTLGVAVPEWMTGAQLFAENDEIRPILSARIKRAKQKDKQNRLIQGDMKPPFYSLGHVDLIRCHRWVSLNLTTGEGLSGYVEGHTSPCSEDRLPSVEEDREYIINHLKSNKYDVSTLVNE